MPTAKLGKIIALALLCAAPAFGQGAQFGLKPVVLSDEPYLFETAEQKDVKLSVISRLPGAPYKLLFLPNGDLLVVLRGSDLRVIHNPTAANPVLDPKPVEGLLPNPPAGEKFELLDIAIHPDFASNGLIYFSGNYVLPKGTRQAHIALLRGKYTDGRVTGVTTLISTDETSFAGGSRLQFGLDGKLYMTTGAPFGMAGQNLGSIYGKVLRVNDDGTIPYDNPYVGADGARPEVFTIGHRDQIGLTMQPGSGLLLTTEHGPNGGDEVNVVRPGKNYGWPLYSYGVQYDGNAVSALPLAEGIEKPLLVWVPSIAPSGLAFYTGDKFPAWKGNLFVTSARRGEINSTGGLERVVFNSQLQELRRETLFTSLRQRFRDVTEGPDGLIYATVDRGQNAIVRIEPVPPSAD